MLKRIRVRVPASTANLGPGFDCLGMAMQLYNEVELVTTGPDTLRVEVVGRPAGEMIPDDERNLAYRAAATVFSMASHRPQFLTVRLLLCTPMARGLGGSAGAIVGGMTAANALLGDMLDQRDLLAAMAQMEGHPDNVCACLYGGLVLSLVTDSGVECRKFVPAPNIRLVLLVPEYELPTVKARQAIPKTIPHRDAHFNVARVPFVIDRLVSGDLAGMATFMDDRLHQPYRKDLVREYDIIASEAENAGAAAVCLSGAGPTMLAVCDEPHAEAVAAAMKNVLDALSVSSRTIITRPDTEGTRIVEREE
jgi:homoserine kinase